MLVSRNSKGMFVTCVGQCQLCYPEHRLYSTHSSLIIPNIKTKTVYPHIFSSDLPVLSFSVFDGVNDSMNHMKYCLDGHIYLVLDVMSLI